MTLPSPASVPCTLVGLSGWPGAGRGVAGRGMVEHGWTCVGSGDVLADVALAVDPLIPLGVGGASRRLSTIVATVGWAAAHRQHGEVRAFMHRLDVAAGRGVFGPGVWTQATITRARRCRPAVIPDVDSVDMVHAVRAAGGIVVRLSRPGAGPRWGAVDLEDPALWDAHVDNTATPATLVAGVLALARAGSDASTTPPPA